MSEKVLCDVYCNHPVHPFIYPLNPEEHRILQTVCHKAVYCKSYNPIECKLSKLYDKLYEFLDAHPTEEYFIRFNKLSPKDAHYFIANDDTDDESMTTETISRDLDMLHIKSAQSTQQRVEQCLKVIAHSDRVYCELAFSDTYDMTLLLLDYRVINHSSETRCFIRGGQLIAISQYYTDLHNVYADTSAVIEKIIQYFSANKNLCSLPDYVGDIYFVAETGAVELIELNPYSHDTDPCLFTWDELDGITGAPVPFRHV